LRILGGLAEPLGEGEQFRRAQLLAREEDHQVLEQGLADLADDLGGQGSRQVHPLHLGTKGAGNGADLEVAIGGTFLHGTPRGSGTRMPVTRRESEVF
jgi:hypothetical protein